ncbi:MAG: peptidoglycan DD-metalloendopeptidase family protein [Firmicutes bacterium]|jgi:murein DD-endopeptidase MepM/ murein hydrolase activator NlpD|nr:peptidoglycan DD-metalloendopeptidase family protein [Bacillota bacterium]
MMPGFRRVVVYVVLACSAAPFLLTGGGLANPSAQELSRQKDALTELQEQIEVTRQELFRFRREEQNALQAVQKIEEELEALRTRITNLDSRLKSAQAQLARLSAEFEVAGRELDVVTRDYERKVGALSQRLVDIYKLGPGTYLEMLLESRDFLDFVTRYELIGMVLEQDLSMFRRVREEKEAIEARREELAQHQRRLEEARKEISLLRSSLKDEERSMASRMAEREYYLKRMRAERARWERELAEEERQSRELEHSIREMQARLGRAGQLVRWRGKFTWPTEGRVTSAFGWRTHPIFGDRRFHSGIDIAARTGTPVVAAADGYVLYSGWISGYGNTVILDHGGGLSTLYGHASSLAVSAGKAVLQGDLIARVGSTGFSTGPHLHFEVRDGGTPKDPMDWLPKR